MANRTMAEGADPLGRIEELHALLTTTSLRRLPLWVLGSDDTQQQIVEVANDESGTREYVIALRALVARNYSTAATYFLDSEHRGLRSPTLRPLLVYALCLAGSLDQARELAPGVTSQSNSERHFWGWMGREFGVGPGVEHGKHEERRD
jgi:hypothetical protein